MPNYIRNGGDMDCVKHMIPPFLISIFPFPSIPRLLPALPPSLTVSTTSNPPYLLVGPG